MSDVLRSTRPAVSGERMRAGRGRDSGSLKRAVAEALEGRQLFADAVGGGGGLVANYYADANFQNLALARTDATIDFDWGVGSPGVGVPAEGFSVRWTGQVTAPAAGTYTLTADSAGGMTVAVGGQTVIDDSAFHARRPTVGTFTFAADAFYDLTVEFKDAGDAAARLLWAPAGQTPAVVPQAQLYRLGTGWVSSGWASDSAAAAAGGSTARALAVTSAAAGAIGTSSFTSTGDSYTLIASTGSSARTLALSATATASASASAGDGAAGTLAYKAVRGDAEVIARLDGASGGAVATVLFRAGPGAAAPFVDLSVSGGLASVRYRTAEGGAIESDGAVAVAGPTYLKLKRDGNAFAGYVSATGADESWELVGTAGATFDTIAEAGMSVAGGVTGGTRPGAGTIADRLPGQAALLAAGPAPTSALVSTAATTAAAASFSQVRVAVSPQLGANLQDLYEASPERPFVDMLKLARTFQLLTGKAAPVDRQGWPTVTDFQAWVGAEGNIAPGRYTITFTGPASAQVYSMRWNTKVSRASYDAKTGRQVWYATVPGGEPSLGFRFRYMYGWRKDLRILQPGYSPTNTPIYTDRYLDFVRHFRPASLRFMDWTRTNFRTNATWGERSTLATADWREVGVPWEACIELCNKVGANLYANVPGRANDDYVRQLAALVRNTLRRDLNVYVEAGNEQWASNFANGPWNNTSALDEVKAAKRAGRESVLNYDHLKVDLKSTNPYAKNAPVWGLRRTARRAKQIGDIFKAVWQGAGQGNPLNTRVRVVCAAQIGNPVTFDIMLKFLRDVYGRPGDYIYSMAGAPYFSMLEYNDRVVNGRWTTLTRSASKGQLLAAMARSAGTYTNQRHFANFWTHGKPYGVRLMMYEGGHDTFGPFNVAAKRAATNDPAMRAIMRGYLSAFFNQGGSAFHFYTLGSKPYNGPFGTWAITEKFQDTDTPKAQAFRDVRAGVGLRNVEASAGVYG